MSNAEPESTQQAADLRDLPAIQRDILVGIRFFEGEYGAVVLRHLQSEWSDESFERTHFYISVQALDDRGLVERNEVGSAKFLTLTDEGERVYQRLQNYVTTGTLDGDGV